MVDEYLAALGVLLSQPELRISTLPGSWSGASQLPTNDLVRELEQMTDEDAERLLEAELRSGLG
jgi:hypothetical protein